MRTKGSSIEIFDILLRGRILGRSAAVEYD